jgi:hypothetical protein
LRPPRISSTSCYPASPPFFPDTSSETFRLTEKNNILCFVPMQGKSALHRKIVGHSNGSGRIRTHAPLRKRLAFARYEFVRGTFVDELFAHGSFENYPSTWNAWINPRISPKEEDETLPMRISPMAYRNAVDATGRVKPSLRCVPMQNVETWRGPDPSTGHNRVTPDDPFLTLTLFLHSRRRGTRITSYRPFPI